MITDKILWDLRTSKTNLKIENEKDLQDLQVLIDEIKQNTDVDKNNIGINPKDYLESGLYNLPAVVTFRSSSLQAERLFDHQGVVDNGDWSSDLMFADYKSGTPPKAVLFPDKFPQYWI